MHRIYCQMRLNQVRRTKKRVPKRERIPFLINPKPNTVRALDFMHDALYGGLGTEIATSLPAARIVRVLDEPSSPASPTSTSSSRFNLLRGTARKSSRSSPVLKFLLDGGAYGPIDIRALPNRLERIGRLTSQTDQPLSFPKMQTELLKVTGMTCGGCTGKVTQALKAVTGVGDVNVSLAAGEATVQYDEHVTSPDQLKTAVKGAGYGIAVPNAAPSQRSKGGCCS